MDELSGVCPACQKRTFLSIDKIEATKRGYAVNGRMICSFCGQAFELGKQIDVELQELKCPSCKSDDLDVTYALLDKINGGYEFTATITCNNLTCSWKKHVVSGVQYVTHFFTKLKRIKLTGPEIGFEIETHPE